MLKDKAANIPYLSYSQQIPLMDQNQQFDASDKYCVSIQKPDIL